MNLDISDNRKSSKYTRQEQMARVAWEFGKRFFAFIPRPFHGLRLWLIRRFGASCGRQVHIYPSAQIEMPWNFEIGEQSAIGNRAIIYNLGQIKIGARTTISQLAHLCAGSHDYKSPTMDLLKLPIVIGNDVWVCADAFIGPGVTIGDGAIVGARAVVTKDVQPWTIVAGNPARVIGKRVLHKKD